MCVEPFSVIPSAILIMFVVLKKLLVEPVCVYANPVFIIVCDSHMYYCMSLISTTLCKIMYMD